MARTRTTRTAPKSSETTDAPETDDVAVITADGDVVVTDAETAESIGAETSETSESTEDVKSDEAKDDEGNEDDDETEDDVLVSVARVAYFAAIEATADDSAGNVPLANVADVETAFRPFTAARRADIAGDFGSEVAAAAREDIATNPAAALRGLAVTAVRGVIDSMKATRKATKVTAPRDLVADAVIAMSSVNLIAEMARDTILSGLDSDQRAEVHLTLAAIFTGDLPVSFSPKWPFGKVKGGGQVSSSGDAVDVLAGIRDAANAADEGATFTVSAMAKILGCGTGSVDDVWKRAGSSDETASKIGRAVAAMVKGKGGKEVRGFVVGS